MFFKARARARAHTPKTRTVVDFDVTSCMFTHEWRLVKISLFGGHVMVVLSAFNEGLVRSLKIYKIYSFRAKLPGQSNAHIYLHYLESNSVNRFTLVHSSFFKRYK